MRARFAAMAAPDKVYRAFLDPEAMAKWLPPNVQTLQPTRLPLQFRWEINNLASLFPPCQRV
jgi:uncharacterized protein YndB with AHSA1/START domain